MHQPPSSENDASFFFPAINIRTEGSATLLAIDDASLTLRHNLCLYLSKPAVRTEPVLVPEPADSNTPDNLAVHFNGTVLYDDGRYRMWYYAVHCGLNPDWPPELMRQLAKHPDKPYTGPLCYAESEDGLHWTKPSLGQVLFHGSRENNILALPHAVVFVPAIVKDESEPDPARRYKMVYKFSPDFSDPPLEATRPTCATAVSADGLHWEVTGTPWPHEFIEHAGFYQHDGKYIVNSHHLGPMIPGEGGTWHGRQGFARMTYDFDNWLTGHLESFLLPEPEDVTQRGIHGTYDQVHLGTAAYSWGTVCVGLYGLWHNTDYDTKFDLCSCDLGLVVSNDGLSFREPVKGHVYLHRDESPVPPVEGLKFNTVLQQGNGFVNVGDETRIYHERWRNAGTQGDIGTTDEIEYYRGEVALATLPRDRWGALGLFPDKEDGFVWTAPVRLPSTAFRLFLNADEVEGAGIEIGDERFGLFETYSYSNFGKVGNPQDLEVEAHWTNSLEPLRGKTVRFRIHLHKTGSSIPRLYAMYLRCDA